LFICGLDQPCQSYIKDEQASRFCNNCKDEDNDGYTDCEGDCDDSNTEEGFYTNPGAEEKCGNLRDDNCNGVVDEAPCCDDSDADGDEVSKCDGDCDDTWAGIQFGCDKCAERWGGQQQFEAERAECFSRDGQRWLEHPTCACADRNPSPIIFDLAGDNFSLTDRAGGVLFDLNSNGHAELIPWTAAGSDDAWLVMDRDGDGRITSGRELFGTYTEQPPTAAPNGFLALAMLDADRDGRVTPADPQFAALRLWVDFDHDGVSRPHELHPLASRGVSSISTAYSETRRRDRHGNEFRYKSEALLGGRRRLVYDVLLTAR